MLKIGLIGCGTHANWAVIPAMGASTDFLRLVAVSDLQQANLDRVEVGGVEKFLDYREMIARCDLDAVYIATLASVREAISLDAIAAGLHVLCEKPMALDCDACTRILDAAEKADRVVGVNFEMRFYDWVRQISDWIGQGLIGRIEAVHMLDMSDSHKAFGPMAERRKRLMDIAGALDCGSHRADLARLFTGGGNWQQIEAHGAWFGETSVPPPHISVLATLENGAHFSLASSMAYTAYIEPRAFQETFTIVGNLGIIHVYQGTDKTVLVELASRDLSKTYKTEHVAHSDIIPAVLREFTARIEGTPHDGILATGEDGLAVQQFVERANASAIANRKPVDVVQSS